MQARRMSHESVINAYKKRRENDARKVIIRRRLELVFGGITVALFVVSLWLFWVMTPSGMVK
ncbi:MAG: hypothetical protein ACRC2H_01115 [Silanimonas sp.]